MKKGVALSPGAILLLCAVYYFEDISSLLALMAAAAAHEVGHVLAISLFGGRVVGLRFDTSGLCMAETGAYTPVQELIILYAGPALGAVPVLLCTFAPTSPLTAKTAAVSMVLTVYNLLPALPLDGGRAVKSILSRKIGRQRAERVMYVMGLVFGAALSATGLFLLGNAYGAALLFAGLWLLIAQTGIVKSVPVL